MASQQTQKYKPRPSSHKGKHSSGSNPAGGFVPRGNTYKQRRADHGRDFITNPGGPLIAPGNGYVIRVGNDPNGFGPNYPIIHFTSGPYAGRDMYIGHTHSALSAGARFQAGAILAYAGTNGVGSAHTPGWVEIGYGIPGTSSFKYGQPPFGGPDSSGTGQSYSAPSSPPTTAGPTDTVPGAPSPSQSRTPQYATPTLPSGFAPPTDPGVPEAPMPELPGSISVSPHDPSEMWRMIANYPLSSPESQRRAQLLGGNV